MNFVDYNGTGVLVLDEDPTGGAGAAIQANAKLLGDRLAAAATAVAAAAGTNSTATASYASAGLAVALGAGTWDVVATVRYVLITADLTGYEVRLEDGAGAVAGTVRSVVTANLPFFQATAEYRFRVTLGAAATLTLAHRYVVNAPTEVTLIADGSALRAYRLY